MYPPSVEPNTPALWRDILDEEHIQWVESPLHDKDLNADGEPKKSHIHILLLFESVKEYEQVKTITEKVNATVPQKCNGAKGLVRYMAHLDNPEKVQYPVNEIVGHGGVDIDDFFRPSDTERYHLIKEMMDYVVKNNVVEMEDLCLYASSERFDDWFPLLCDSCAYIMGTFVKSRRHRKEITSFTFKVDSETGEIKE